MTPETRKSAGKEIRRLIREAATLATTHNLDVDIGNDEDWDESIRLDAHCPIHISYTESI